MSFSVPVNSAGEVFSLADTIEALGRRQESEAQRTRVVRVVDR